MSATRTFRKVKGKWVRAKNPTSEQSRSMSEQLAKMFTPDGQFRMVIEAREKASKGLLRPMSLQR